MEKAAAQLDTHHRGPSGDGVPKLIDNMSDEKKDAALLKAVRAVPVRIWRSPPCTSYTRGSDEGDKCDQRIWRPPSASTLRCSAGPQGTCCPEVVKCNVGYEFYGGIHSLDFPRNVDEICLP